MLTLLTNNTYYSGKPTNQIKQEQVQLEGTATRKLKKEMTQSTHVVNSIQKSRFPSTDARLHPQNQSPILTQSKDIVRILPPNWLKTC